MLRSQPQEKKAPAQATLKVRVQAQAPSVPLQVMAIVPLAKAQREGQDMEASKPPASPPGGIEPNIVYSGVQCGDILNSFFLKRPVCFTLLEIFLYVNISLPTLLFFR